MKQNKKTIVATLIFIFLVLIVIGVPYLTSPTSDNNKRFAWEEYGNESIIEDDGGGDLGEYYGNSEYGYSQDGLLNNVMQSDGDIGSASVDCKDEEDPNCKKCQVNFDGHLDFTMDKCVIKDKGNVCNGKDPVTEWKEAKCCDWNKDPKEDPEAVCECNTQIAGPCLDNDACICCMMLAEAANENGKDCKQAVYCVMKNRADDKGVSICQANSMKVGDGNTASFTSDKCTCDRYGDGLDKKGKKQYNQTYCDCREKICDDPEKSVSAFEGCEDMLKLTIGANCDSGVNTYRIGKCPKNCTTVPGLSHCKHAFCKC